MQIQMLFTISSASFGFVAGIYFCKGSALLSNKKIVSLSIPRIGHNPDQVDAIVSQAAQYLVGATLLCISCLLQVQTILAPTGKQIYLYPNLLSIVEYPLVLVAAIFGIAYIFEILIYKIRRPQIQREIDERTGGKGTTTPFN